MYNIKALKCAFQPCSHVILYSKKFTKSLTFDTFSDNTAINDDILARSSENVSL